MQRKKLWIVGEAQPIIEFNMFGQIVQNPIEEMDVKDKLYKLNKIPIFVYYDNALNYARSLRYVVPATSISSNFPRKRQFAPIIEIDVEATFINMIASFPIETVSLQFNSYNNFMSNFSNSSTYENNVNVNIKWIPTNILYPSLVCFRSVLFPDSGFETTYFIPDEPAPKQKGCTII